MVVDVFVFVAVFRILRVEFYGEKIFYLLLLQLLLFKWPKYWPEPDNFLFPALLWLSRDYVSLTNTLTLVA